MDTADDAALVVLARDGDAEAFRVLMRRYQPMVESLARSLVAPPHAAEDLAQEALVQAWLSLEQLRDATRFKSWLHGIVVNVGRTWRRRQPPAALPLRDGDGDAVDPYAPLELRWVLQAAVWELSGSLRGPMSLFYFDDLSISEVADRLDLPPGTVKRRLHQGRRRLQQRLAVTAPDLIPASVKRSAQRRPHMTEVRIATVVPFPSRVLVMLVDDARRRALPLWLGPTEAHALVASIDAAASLLEATGGSVRDVQISDLGDDTFAARLRLDTPAGGRSIEVRLGDGLALARRGGSRILVDEEVAARLALDLPADGSLQAVIETAAANAGLPLHALAPDQERVSQPRNLAFADELRYWHLRGSFLHDMSARHWQDYTAGIDELGAYLKATVRHPHGFADLRQGILADNYRSGTVRLEADLKTAGLGDHASLYLRIVDPERRNPPEHRHQVTVQGTQDWKRLHVEAEVPPETVFILFGVSLTGPGQIWLANPAIHGHRNGVDAKP
jgi:RNA polymerase sigma factor (sigma-70 family)